MGLRQWFVDLLSRGELPPVDPDAVTEADVVPLARGPMLLTALEESGIQASGIESFDVVTDARTLMRIMVRQADVARARQVIERNR